MSNTDNDNNNKYVRCPKCDVAYNTETKLYEVSSGKPLTPTAFAKKVCCLDGGAEGTCINDGASSFTKKDCVWETASNLDRKSIEVLKVCGVNDATIEHLSEPFHRRNYNY